MPPSRSDELRALLARSGREALTRFGRVRAEHKVDGSPVTEADRAVEEVLVEGLTRAFPDDAVVGEEGARAAGRPGGGTWHVDPIDGTSSYLLGLAYWGPTVCRVVDGRLDIGAFWVPRLEEFWFAEAGGGAWLDGRRLPALDGGAVRPDSVLYAPSRFHRAGPVPWPGKVRALGSSAAHLALVAGGRGALAVVPRWSLWDVGCGALLIREVAGVISSASGTPVDVSGRQGLPLLAGAPTAVRALTTDGWAASVLRTE